MKRLTVLCLTFLVALGFAVARPGSALADGGDNLAIAINTKDGSSVFRLAFSIRKAAGDVVDETNAAVAFSSCSDCQTVAIAVQIVLITGDPSTVTPTNLALAINFECSSCETLATAYQWVLSTGGPVRFTAEGRKELARIRHELLKLAKSELSITEIQARVEALMRDLARVLQTELEPAGKPREDDERDDGEDEVTVTTTTLPTTTTTTPTSTETAQPTTTTTSTETTTTTGSTTTTTP